MHLPAELVRDPQIKRNDLVVAHAVWDAVPITRKDPSTPWPYCFLSRRQLEESTGLSRSQVERSLAHLAKLGHLRTVQRSATEQTYWRKILTLPQRGAGAGFAKFRSTREFLDEPETQPEDKEEPVSNQISTKYSDDDDRPTARDYNYDPTPEDLAEVQFPESDFDRVLPLSQDDVVVDAASRFRSGGELPSKRGEEALRIANEQRSALKLALVDTPAERKAIGEAVNRCRSLPVDPRDDLADSMSMDAFVGYVVAAMVAAHSKAKSKPHLRDGCEATASGLLSRMANSSVCEKLLTAGLAAARRGTAEQPRQPNLKMAVGYGPRR